MRNHNRLEHVAAAFREFVNAETWVASRSVLARHGELLTDKADRVIRAEIKVAAKQLTEEALGSLEVHQALLRRCRAVGIDAAFADVTSGSSLQPDIADLAEQLLGILTPSTQPRSSEDLQRAQATARALLDHRRLESLLGDHRASVLNLAAMALLHAYQTLGTVADLEASLVAMDESLELTPPGNPDRPACLSNRAAALSELYSRTGKPADREESLAAKDEALRLSPPGSSDRPTYLNNRASGLLDRYAAAGGVSDLDDALSALDEALRLSPHDNSDRPMYLNNRANCLSNRYARTGGATDLDAAIAGANEALALTALGSPERPGYLNNHSNRIALRYARTGEEADLNEALAAINEALVLTAPGSPDRPMYLNNRALRLSDRYVRNGGAADLDAALNDLDATLDLAEAGSPDRPRYLNNRANRLSDRYARTGNAADLDAALIDLEAALLLTDLDSPERPGRLNNRAEVLADRYARTGEPTDLDAALAAISEALATVPDGSPSRPGFLNNRSNRLWDRYARTGNETDIDAALADLDEALRLAPSVSPNRPLYLTNRGNRLSDRYARRHSLVDLSAAIADLDEALELTPLSSPERPGRLNNRANLLADRYALKGNSGDLDAALAEMGQVLELSPPGSQNRPGYLNNRANRLSDLYALKRNLADLDAALADLDEALELTPPSSPERPGRLNNRANVLSDRHARTGNIVDLEAGVASYRQACKAGIQDHPEAALLAASSWSTWATDRAAWQEAAEAGVLGLEAADMLVLIQAMRVAKESRLRDAEGIAARTAYACGRLDDGRRAAIAAERGRAVLLAEAVAVRATLDRLVAAGKSELVNTYEKAAARLASSGEPPLDEPRRGDAAPSFRHEAQADLEHAIEAIRAMPGFDRFLRRPSDDEVFAEVTAGASECPIVYLLATESGGMSLTVMGDGTVRIMNLPALIESILLGKVSKYVEASNAFRDDHRMSSAWLDVIDDTAHWLWIAVGGPLMTYVRSAGIERATLVPMGLLGLLPLHAAWVEDGHPESGRHYLLDDVCIAYAPNAQSLAAARATTKDEEGSILAVDEPWPVKDPDIRGSAPLVGAMVAHFPGSATVLRHHDATRKDVLAALTGKTVVHLSCHGRAQPDRPLESLLLMAFDETLTLADLLGRRLDGTRLVVLSACETSFPGSELPDEVVSLPTGLLQAGAAAAIGSLWSVDDLATMVLLTRFYQLWRSDGLTIPEALRGAQHWVRDLTREERDAAFPDVDFVGSGSPGPHPYARPFWWASFGLTGG